MAGSEAARRVLAAVLGREPTLAGRGRAVAVDGPAGSGKTTLAEQVADLARAHGSVTVVHLDDLYDGWRGVLSVNALVATLLRCLHADGTAAYRRYDWHREEYAEVVEVDLPDLLVVEGVGASVPAVDPLTTLRVWVDAPQDRRLARGLARDGEHLRAQWEQFLVDEVVVHERDRSRERADLVVDGLTGEVSLPGSSAAPAPRGPR